MIEPTQKMINDKRKADKMRKIISKAKSKVIIDLQSDLKEAYELIVELGIYNKQHDQFGIWEHCQCGNHNMYNPLEPINHRDDCLVKKAILWLENN